MKKNKEIISLNSIKDEFSKEMGIDERFKILSLSEQQKIVGGDSACPTMDPPCGCMNVNSWNCTSYGVPGIPTPPSDSGCGCNGQGVPGCICDGYNPCQIDHYSTT